MLEELKKDAAERMHKSVEATAKDLGTIRTGKASIHLLDTVKVEAYGSLMPLNQVATASTPEPRLLVVTAFDKTTVGNIIKGIQKADLGLNPQADGGIIRIPIPALNEDRRKELARHCKKSAEDGKIAVRNVRRDANEHIKKAKQAKEISEDQEADLHDEIQALTDKHTKEIDEMLVKKEAEVMEI